MKNVILSKTRLLLTLFCLTTLASCAATQDPAYVSPSLYQGYNCRQLHAEKLRLASQREQSMRTEQTNRVLNTAIDMIALANGRSVSDDAAKNNDLGRLQNQYNLVEQDLVKQDCDL